MVTIKNIMTSPEFNHITLAAGKNGMDRPITGINVTEAAEFPEFYRPNELLVTTGINMANDANQLIELVKCAFHHKAAGLVLNTGPFIPSIPEPVLRFADEYQFPIFQMPWRCRVADFLKSAIQLLAILQTAQSKHEQILSALLFENNLTEEGMERELLQIGFKKKAEFGMIVCTPDNPKFPVNSFVDEIKSEFSKRYIHVLSMVYENQFIYLFDRTEVQTPNIPFSKTAENIQIKIEKRIPAAKVYIGMGNFYQQIKGISTSYVEARAVIHLAQKHQNAFIYKYKDIGAYKILMSVREERIIKNFYEDMLGSLCRYDELHGTDLIDFLRIFLEENGSTVNISRREFIHRNTVLYKVKKIEMILDVDLTNSFTKTNLSLAYMIEDLIK